LVNEQNHCGQVAHDKTEFSFALCHRSEGAPELNHQTDNFVDDGDVELFHGSLVALGHRL
jgi:hypothetical protein